MLQTIVNFFTSIWDTLGTYINLVTHYYQSLLDIIRNIPLFVNLVDNTLSYLPNIFVVFVHLTVSISIVYLLIGRSHGGNS